VKRRVEGARAGGDSLLGGSVGYGEICDNAQLAYESLIVEQCQFYGKSMEYLDAMLISAGSDLSGTGSFAMVTSLYGMSMLRRENELARALCGFEIWHQAQATEVAVLEGTHAA